MNLTFTVRALATCLQFAPDDTWFETFDVPSSGEWNVLAFDVDGERFIFHRDDRDRIQRVIFIGEDGATALHGLPTYARRHALQRAHRAALAASTPPLWLPPEWSAFHEGNLIAFFATNRELGNFRWVMEVVAGDTQDVCFWRLTSAERHVLLESFTPDS